MFGIIHKGLFSRYVHSEKKHISKNYVCMVYVMLLGILS